MCRLGKKEIFNMDSHWFSERECVCCVCVNRLRSMLDKGGAVKNFVDALQQLTNPEMIFKVTRANLNMN